MNLFDAQKYRDKKICVALSGGMDSVCLLHCFLLQAAACGITLSAVHVEHGIRGEESLRDMRFCEALCKEWNIPLKVERVNVSAFVEEHGGGVEGIARRMRLNVFRELLRTEEADLIATAHHRGDVAETVLFRLARGTSPSGMRAITECDGLVRPLLDVPREKISAYVAENALPFVEDSTNSDEKYTRNYIRHTVLPAFEKIHGHAAEHLVQFAAQCAKDDAYLMELARREIKIMGESDKLVPVALPDPLFARACLWCMDAEKDYTSANLEEIERLKKLQSGRKVCLPGEQFASREYDNIVFYRETPPSSERPFDAEEFARPSVLREKLRADLDAFPMDCVVRTRREGDFIVPFGGHTKSLKKFLTDKKISARLGKKLSLIAHGAEILVVMGVEISERVKVTDGTRRIGYFG